MSYDFEKAHPRISKYEYSNYTCELLCPLNCFFFHVFKKARLHIKAKIAFSLLFFNSSL